MQGYPYRLKDFNILIPIRISNKYTSFSLDEMVIGLPMQALAEDNR